MTEITKEQARKLQQNVYDKRKQLPTNTLFDDINNENKKLNDPAKGSPMVELLRIRFKEGKSIFLKGNIPSSKNSKQIQERYTGRSICCNAEYDRKTKICENCGKTTGSAKRPMLVNSEVVQKYILNHESEYDDIKPLFLSLIRGQSLPIQLGVYFVRDSRRTWDVGNACQIITDLMKAHHLIPDDDATNITCVFLGFHVDPQRPGCMIRILDSDKFNEQLIKLI